MLDSGCTTFTRADFFTSFKGESDFGRVCRVSFWSYQKKRGLAGNSGESKREPKGTSKGFLRAIWAAKYVPTFGLLSS